MQRKPPELVDEPGYRPAYEYVAERLADHIKSSRLAAGDRLPTEAQLAQDLGVGRSIVREAVKILGALGLVEARRGSGLYVGEGTRSFLARLGPTAVTVRPDQVSSLLAFRLVQEHETARLAAERSTVSTLRELERLLRANEAAVATGPEEFRRTDAALHLAIAEASGNLFLLELVDQILRVQSAAIEHIVGGTPGSRADAAAEHAKVVEAIRDGDPEAARDAMAAHLRGAERRYDVAVLRLLQRPGAPHDDGAAVAPIEEPGLLARPPAAEALPSPPAGTALAPAVD